MKAGTNINMEQTTTELQQNSASTKGATLATLKKATAAALATVLVLGALGTVGCTTTPKKGLEVDTGLTGGVAATVNGTEIPEDQVTRRINSQRINAGADAETDDGWAKYLNEQGYTPKSLRDKVLEALIDQELVKQFAADEDSAATDEEIQGQVDKMRGNYSSDEAWATALEDSGFDDEEAYREALRYAIAYKKLGEKLKDAIEVDDAKLLEEAQTKLNGKGTMRRSSHILFKKEDEATAQDVLAQIQAGTLDFAEAAKEYSTDTGSAEKGGDVGWDGMTTFVEEYQSALSGLEVNQTTELVESQYGYHIIRCTDKVDLPDEITEVSQVPESLLADIRTSVQTTEGSTALTDWIKEKKESSDIQINEMPENVPYNVDMSAYETSAAEEAKDETAEKDLVENVEDTANAVDTAEAETSAASETSASTSTETSTTSASTTSS